MLTRSLRTAPGRRTAVTFKNSAGLTLFGVLHEPDRQTVDACVLLLSPGVKMRVGPERLYLRMADLCVRLGMPVLRFDCFGLGDSEGTLPESLLRDVYGNIEVGRFVGDTVDAMNWMQSQHGQHRFILSGLCGGAITGLLAGARDSRVAGLWALAITPLLASQSADPSRYMTTGQLHEIGRTYLTKVFDPKAWLRIVTLQSDYRLIWRAVARFLVRKPAVATVGATAAAGSTPVTPAEPDNASPLFPPAFFAMLNSRRPMLLIFGGSDRLGWEFDEKFVARHGAQLSAAPAYHQVHTIAEANHVLSFAAWQQEMLDVSERWLRSRFTSDRPTESRDH